MTRGQRTLLWAVVAAATLVGLALLAAGVPETAVELGRLVRRSADPVALGAGLLLLAVAAVVAYRLLGPR